MKLKWWLIGYLVAIAIALISPLASGSPDGLERVAEDHGFIHEAIDAPYSVIADYVFPGIENKAVATMLAGVVGVTILFIIVGGSMYIWQRQIKTRRTSGA